MEFIARSRSNRSLRLAQFRRSADSDHLKKRLLAELAMIRAPVLLRSLSTAPVVLRRGVASNAAALLAEDDALSKARPFSEVPSPRGAIPLLGHLPLLANKSGKERFELFGRLLKELGPIVRLKLPRPRKYRIVT